VTHAAPYRHFTDKQALLATVAEEGFRMLASQMSEAWRRHEGGSGATGLEAIGVAYIRFATGQRAHFQVMFGKDIDWSRKYSGLEETADCCFGGAHFRGAGVPGSWRHPSGRSAHPIALCLVDGARALGAHRQRPVHRDGARGALVEELVSIFNRILIEGARAKE
jgi:AcrR family transcriptional regulator